MGLKASDLYVAPLCSTCHGVYHASGSLPAPIAVREWGDIENWDPGQSRDMHIEANRDALADYVEQLEGKK